MTEKIPYWRYSSFWKKWELKSGEEGCVLCTDESVKLSMDKPPPPLRDQPAPPKADKAKKSGDKEKEDPYVRMFEGALKVVGTIRRIQEWAHSPTPAPQPRKISPTVLGEKSIKIAPKFDIAEIPNTIRSLGMPKAGAMFDKWFSGELNYSPNDDDSRHEINQKGEAYPQSMIDTSSISTDWVLSFPRAKKEFDFLVLNKTLSTEKAIESLRKASKRAKNKYRLDTWHECDGDMGRLHRNFQFQRVQIEGELWQKFRQYSERLLHAGMPDELTLILGSFNLYAAIAHACFEVSMNKPVLRVTHIFVYVKDGFTFTDNERASQYLGHWSKSGVAVALLKQASVTLGHVDWIDVPIIDKSSRELGLMYPVKNSDFRAWQLKHQQGGDYIIYSTRKIVLLKQPLVVLLD